MQYRVVVSKIKMHRMSAAVPLAFLETETWLDPSILQSTTSWQALALEPGGSSLSTFLETETWLDPSILQSTTSWQALALEPGGSSLSTTCMQWNKS